MELIYIGDKFYSESKSVMSSIYDIEGKRQDWGFVQIALRNGEDVHILQATNSELEYYEKKLQRFKDNMNNEEKKERVVVSQTAKPNVLI